MTLGLYGDGRMSLEDARKAITMPHARESGLQRLAPMLEQLRKIKALKEARPGIFRFRSKPFLHLHHLVAHVRLSAPEFDSLDHSRGGRKLMLPHVPVNKLLFVQLRNMCSSSL